MGRDRLTVFDTTLRDGEAGAGILDADSREGPPGEAAGHARGRHPRGRVPHRLRGGRRGRQGRGGRRAAARHRRLARACAGDIDKAGWALRGAARARIHTFIATSDLHLERKLNIDARGVSRSGHRRRRPRPPLYGRRAILGGGRDAQRHRLPVPRGRGRHRRRRHHDQPARHRRLSTPDEMAGFFARSSAGCPKPTRRCSARTATTTWGWRWRIRWPPSARACARSSAPSTDRRARRQRVARRGGDGARVRPDRHPYDTGLDTRAIYGTSQLLTELTGQAVQSNKAIVGRNAFAHEAGIHQDGILKDGGRTRSCAPRTSACPPPRWCSGSTRAGTPCRSVGATGGGTDAVRSGPCLRQMVSFADAHKHVTDAQLRAIIGEVRASEAAGNRCGRPAAPARVKPDLQGTVAEPGYGHGV